MLEGMHLVRVEPVEVLGGVLAVEAMGLDHQDVPYKVNGKGAGG